MVYLGYLSVIEALELAHAAGVADGLVKEITLASETLSPQSEVFLDIYERRGSTRAPPPRTTFATYAARPTRTWATPSRWATPMASTCPARDSVSTMGTRCTGSNRPDAGRPGVPRSVAREGRRWRSRGRRRSSSPASRSRSYDLRPDGRMPTNPMAVLLGDDGG